MCVQVNLWYFLLINYWNARTKQHSVPAIAFFVIKTRNMKFQNNWILYKWMEYIYEVVWYSHTVNENTGEIWILPEISWWIQSVFYIAKAGGAELREPWTKSLSGTSIKTFICAQCR